MQNLKIRFLVIIFSLAVQSVILMGAGDRDIRIDQLFNNYFRDMIALVPETASELGLTESFGIPFRQDELADISEKGEDRIYELSRRYLDRLREYDPDAMNTRQKIASDTLKWHLERTIEGEKYRHHVYVVNQMFGFHNSLTTLMTEHHQLHDIEDAEAYIQRLRAYKTRFAQLQEQIEIRERKGMTPPRKIVERTLESITEFISQAPDQNILYISFRDRLDKLKNVKKKQRNQLCSETLAALEEVVYPCYREMIRRLAALQEKTSDDPGAWRLPDGDKYYEYCLHLHTSTDLTPEEIYRIGCKETARVQDEMRRIYTSLGIRGGNTFGELSNQYRRSRNGSPDAGYPDTKKGRLLILRDYQKIIDSTYDRLPELFSLIPGTRVRAERVPLYKEKTMGTYYQPPRLDGSEGGIFYVNLSHSHSRSGMQTLTYHEAIPGHHFQFAIQQELFRDQLFRHLMFFTGFIEGWALYAEKLALENGYFEDAHSILGCLGSELFRAVRLVVDTGIHYKKWSRQQAYDYMEKNQGWGSYAEIDRYSVWPGQACAYKIGELKILEFRERMKKELGSGFDIREFHREVLQNGSIPLKILEGVVNEYVRQKK